MNSGSLNQTYGVVQVELAPLLDVRCHGGAEHGDLAPAVVVAGLEDHSQLKTSLTKSVRIFLL